MKIHSLKIAVLFLLGFLLIQCSLPYNELANQLKRKAPDSKCSQNLEKKIVTLKSINDRYLNPECYFKHELKSYPKTNKTALAMSGGGIRSNAYHLGLLTGLHRLGVLNELDYIASVSGGGWAHGSFQSFNGSNEEFFNCLEKSAKLSKTRRMENSCSNLLRACQVQDREGWRKDIVMYHLYGKDISFETLKKINKDQDRPYPIFYSTLHYDNRKGKALISNCRNLPFEFTLDQLGSPMICRFEGESFFNFLNKGVPSPGLFVKLNDQHFDYTNNFVKSNKLLVADALRASSAFWVPLLGYRFSVNESGNPIPQLGVIDFADGGLTDNFGLTPLLERQVSKIILSDITKTPDESLKEIKNAADYAEMLLNVRVDFKEGVDGCNDKCIRNCFNTEKRMVQHNIYSFYENEKKQIGTLYSLRPTTVHNAEFIEFLSRKLNRMDLVKEVKKVKDFPRVGTISPCYSTETIHALYYLGFFMVQKEFKSICEIFGKTECQKPEIP